MRRTEDSIQFSPQLPEGITRLAFGVVFRERRIRVEVTPSSTTYTLHEGDEIEILHRREVVTLVKGRPAVITTEVPDSNAAVLRPPSQPLGRAPAHRVAQGNNQPNELRTESAESIEGVSH
jgi:alpha,alpha-trehalose phosphorylase